MQFFLPPQMERSSPNIYGPPITTAQSSNPPEPSKLPAVGALTNYEINFYPYPYIRAFLVRIIFSWLTLNNT